MRSKVLNGLVQVTLYNKTFTKDLKAGLSRVVSRACMRSEKSFERTASPSNTKTFTKYLKTILSRVIYLNKCG